jgi:uncharacterized protein YxjI
VSSLAPKLSSLERIFVRQTFEAAELFGFETRNKYQVLDERQSLIAFAAEQRKGIIGFLLRQYLGHWYKFDVHFFGPDRQPFLIAKHPFRWFFQRIELHDLQGKLIGALQKRFSILTKRFDVENEQGQVILEVASPVWKIWSFGFTRHGRQAAMVRKKWSGLFAEAFTDKDNYLVEFEDPSMSEDERRLVMVAAVFIDLLYFETKAD